MKLELESLNNKIETSNTKDKNNHIKSSFQAEIKSIQKVKENLEITNQKQKNYISSLKNIIINYEKEIAEKNNYINELKQKIEELNNKIKNMIEETKKEYKKEIIKLNEQINVLQNKLELKEQDTEFNNIKYNNLQIKYLKMIHNKKKMEQENLLIESMNQVRNKKKQNTINKFSKNKKNYNDNMTCDTSIVLPLLKEKNNNIRIIKNIEEDQIQKENENILINKKEK